MAGQTAVQIAMSITPKERSLMEDIINNQYNNDGVDGSPWSWSVCDGSHSKAGVLSSLEEKGVCFTDDHEGKGRNRDMICGFTKTGKEVYALLIAREESLKPKAERPEGDPFADNLTDQCIAAGTDWAPKDPKVLEAEIKEMSLGIEVVEEADPFAADVKVKGYNDAQKALATTKGVNPPAPNRKQREQYKENWQDYLAGWSQAVREKKTQDSSWDGGFFARPTNQEGNEMTMKTADTAEMIDPLAPATTTVQPVHITNEMVEQAFSQNGATDAPVVEPEVKEEVELTANGTPIKAKTTKKVTTKKSAPQPAVSKPASAATSTPKTGTTAKKATAKAKVVVPRPEKPAKVAKAPRSKRVPVKPEDVVMMAEDEIVEYVNKLKPSKIKGLKVLPTDVKHTVLRQGKWIRIYCQRGCPKCGAAHDGGKITTYATNGYKGAKKEVSTPHLLYKCDCGQEQFLPYTGPKPEKFVEHELNA